LAAFVFAVPVRADDQADARKIIDKAIAAHGGTEALAKHRAGTTKMKGKWYGMGEGLEYTGSFGIQPPDRFHFKIEMNIMGQAFTFLQGVNGDKGWLSFNGMVQDLAKEHIAEVKEALHVHDLTRLVCLTGKDYKLSTLGESKVDNRAALGVHVERKDRRDVNLFFDKENGLLLKTETRAKDPMMGDAEFTEERIFRDYKKVGALMVPHKVEVKRDNKLYVEGETTEFTASEKLDDALFTKP
jgi:hypothetical protein